MTIPNPSSQQPISELVLAVQPLWYLNAFTLHELSWEDGTTANYSIENIRLIIPLDAPLPPHTARTLNLRYTLQLPPIIESDEFGPIPFGYTSRQINLVDWYPFVPPYQEEAGWIVHNPWYYGEHLFYPVGGYQVSLKVINAPASTVVAASAPDTGDGETHRYQLENARNFVASISASYHTYEEQVGDTVVRGYVFPQHQTAGQAAFNTTVEALQLYSELFGPYPHASLTIIEADFEHGMEYQGLYYLSNAFFNTFDGKAGSYLVAIAAHETAHQWWYGLVGNDQALEPWLDEALCTYSERLFYENLYPNSLDWWWYARVNYYQPQGWVDTDIYYAGGYRPYRDAVYLNGAMFLEDLRTSIGDEAFFAFLRDYAERYRYQIATRADFFDTLAHHTNMDLRALVGMYFQR